MARSPLLLVIVGDSTVCNYPKSRPERGWGQFIGEYFKEGNLRVINLAASGRSTKTFISEGRWQKALDEKPDYVLIQFGHNDSHASEKPESTDASTTYKANLRRYIDEARAIGAIPILVTPMVRRTFDAAGKITDAKPPSKPLESYAIAMKQVAVEKKVALINLFTSSKQLADKLGPSGSAEMEPKKGDNTHFNEKGARAMADLVVKELPDAVPKLAASLKTP